ncbi:tail fiber protein [Fusibacter paucivorans]|uniref:Tail fiber protein n=1 Tax=Fusibacter paucivorans TaxID=76009 RepID=A0ABS5PP29_9FIRM|nr:tail fiber protein [Fusibacter paucivorans]MBS7526928.1 tail fiber protein [Fusibacter paucivorans]
MSVLNGYVGEIRLYANVHVPENWECCNGQTLSISDYQALYDLIGTTYGGDGTKTFALPDLRGRVPIHMGTSKESTVFKLGDKKGALAVQLTEAQLPEHTHMLMISSEESEVTVPEGNTISEPPFNLFKEFDPSEKVLAMAADTVIATGGDQYHDNMQPYTSLNFIICVKEDTVDSEGVEDDMPMSQFIGEVRAFPFGFVPEGWLACDGKILNEYDYFQLSSILGQTFGGVAPAHNFGLPNLNKRIPIHNNPDFALGKMGGSEKVQIGISEMPKHTHGLMVIDDMANETRSSFTRMIATANKPGSRALVAFCDTKTNYVEMSDQSITVTGESVAHDNVMPCLSLQYCIAYKGKYAKHHNK